MSLGHSTTGSCGVQEAATPLQWCWGLDGTQWHRGSSTQPPAPGSIPSLESGCLHDVFGMLMHVPMHCVCQAHLLLWVLPLLLAVPIISFARCSCSQAGPGLDLSLCLMGYPWCWSALEWDAR